MLLLPDEDFDALRAIARFDDSLDIRVTVDPDTVRRVQSEASGSGSSQQRTVCHLSY